MKRLGIWCVAGLCTAAAPACDRGISGDSAVETKAAVGDEPGPTRLISAEGCLTSSGDRFVLTALETDGVAAESYRLVGRDEDLRAHVGKRVQISGESEPEQVVDLRQSTTSLDGTGPTGTSGATPQVETTTTTRIEVHDLRVRTITPSDEPCPSGR